MVPFESFGMISYLPSIVTMVLSCIICEINDLLVENRKTFIPDINLAPLHRVTPSKFCKDV